MRMDVSRAKADRMERVAAQRDGHGRLQPDDAATRTWQLVAHDATPDRRPDSGIGRALRRIPFHAKRPVHERRRFADQFGDDLEARLLGSPTTPEVEVGVSGGRDGLPLLSIIHASDEALIRRATLRTRVGEIDDVVPYEDGRLQPSTELAASISMGVAVSPAFSAGGTRIGL